MSPSTQYVGYRIPGEFEDLRATVRQIAQERIVPRAPDIDRAAEYPQDIRELLAENDIFGLPFAEEYGGTGAGTLMLQIAVEEIAKADASCALMLMLQELGTLPITLFGTEDLKRRFLPKCASGAWAPAFALSEAEAGSNAAAMCTTAVQDGDEWVINGTTTWISNAGVADFYVVFAVTDRAAGRVTAFVVEADRPGFSIGGYEHKLGIKGSPTGSPVFEDVRVPAENVIGEVGRGMRVALGTLERTRLGAAAQAVGIAEGAIDTRSTTRRNESCSASRSSSCRECSSSLPICKPGPLRPENCCTAHAPSPTTSQPLPTSVCGPRWRSCSPQTTL